MSAEIGQAWLKSAKLARKSCQWQTAYSTMLQVKQANVPFAFIEGAKLVNAEGEQIRALHDLENALRIMNLLDVPKDDVVDLTADDTSKALTAKVRRIWFHLFDRVG